LVAAGAQHGSITGQKWRFAFFSEAYATHSESSAQARRTCERFVDAVLAEFGTIAVTPASTPEKASLLLLRAELMFGLLVSLSFRGENDVVRVMAGACRLLFLRAMPVLLSEQTEEAGDGAEPTDATLASPRARDAGELFGISVATSLLHKLCEHLCAGLGNTAGERLIAACTDMDGQNAVGEDRPLPVGFSRRPPPGLAELLCELKAALGQAESLQAALSRHVPLDSPIMRGAEATAESSKKARATAGSGASAKRTPRGRAKKQLQHQQKGSGKTGKGVGKGSSAGEKHDLGADVTPTPPKRRKVSSMSHRKQQPDATAVAAGA